MGHAASSRHWMAYGPLASARDASPNAGNSPRRPRRSEGEALLGDYARPSPGDGDPAAHLAGRARGIRTDFCTFPRAPAAACGRGLRPELFTSGMCEVAPSVARDHVYRLSPPFLDGRRQALLTWFAQVLSLHDDPPRMRCAPPLEFRRRATRSPRDPPHLNERPHRTSQPNRGARCLFRRPQIRDELRHNQDRGVRSSRDSAWIRSVAEPVPNARIERWSRDRVSARAMALQVPALRTTTTTSSSLRT